MTNFIILNKEEKEPFIKLAKELCKEESQVIKHQMPKMKTAFERCSFKQQGYSWDQMNYVILAGLLADLGVVTSLTRSGMMPHPPKRIDGGAWYYWGLERGPTSKRHFGTNFDGDEDGGTGHIWSRLVKKPTINPLDNRGRAIMLALSKKPLTSKEIADVTGLSIDTVKEDLKKLYSYHYFIKEEDKFDVNFPIFSPRDRKIMIGEIIKVSDLIVESVLKPKETNFHRLFEEAGLAKLEREYGAYLCMIYHIIMDHTLDALVESNLLPELPTEARATWGFWGWIGKFDIEAL